LFKVAQDLVQVREYKKEEVITSQDIRSTFNFKYMTESHGMMNKFQKKDKELVKLEKQLDLDVQPKISFIWDHTTKNQRWEA